MRRITTSIAADASDDIDKGAESTGLFEAAFAPATADCTSQRRVGLDKPAPITMRLGFDQVTARRSGVESWLSGLRHDMTGDEYE